VRGGWWPGCCWSAGECALLALGRPLDPERLLALRRPLALGRALDLERLLALGRALARRCRRLVDVVRRRVSSGWVRWALDCGGCCRGCVPGW